MSFCPWSREVTSRWRSIISRATASTGRGPMRLPQTAPAKTAALKIARLRIRMTNPPKGSESKTAWERSRVESQNHFLMGYSSMEISDRCAGCPVRAPRATQTQEIVSTLIKKAASRQEFARPCGLIDYQGIDILSSLKGEDSYGVAVSASHGLFGGFLLHREALLRFSPQASHQARPALGRLDKGSLER